MERLTILDLEFKYYEDDQSNRDITDLYFDSASNQYIAFNSRYSSEMSHRVYCKNSLQEVINYFEDTIGCFLEMIKMDYDENFDDPIEIFQRNQIGVNRNTPYTNKVFVYADFSANNINELFSQNFTEKMITCIWQEKVSQLFPEKQIADFTHEFDKTFMGIISDNI